MQSKRTVLTSLATTKHALAGLAEARFAILFKASMMATLERRSSHLRLKASGKLLQALSLVERSTAPKASLSKFAGTL